jgi:hypothetical protein
MYLLFSGIEAKQPFIAGIMVSQFGTERKHAGEE